MMVLVVLLVLMVVMAMFLLGFRLGGDHWQSELLRVRLEAARAERQLHDLTRQTFVAMAEQAEQLRGR
ncbi:MAG TPA: hypothetical protein VM938_06110 [Acidimicrobiales bacterium]|nr:hypothetical protein [Acidimicrobiales bacterium]